MQTATIWAGILSATLIVAANAEIPNDPTMVQPLPVGAKAPAFTARTKDGVIRTFRPDGYEQPTIVIFYRGGWCPYCNMQRATCVWPSQNCGSRALRSSS